MYYGFDVGGTKIEFGAYDENLNRVVNKRFATEVSDYSKLLDLIVDTVIEFDLHFRCKGQVGIGIPGYENRETGNIVAVNIPAADGKPFRSDIEQLISRKIRIENDANCFVLSEATNKQLQGKQTVLGLILGTGFGGGMVLDNKLVSGFNRIAGEFGHMKVPINAWLALGDKPPMFSCGCGQSGCLDNYLSGRGFELLYNYYTGIKKSSVDIIRDYRSKEQKSIEFVERFGELLAACFANILTALDPDVVVLGGGLSNFSELYQLIPVKLENYILPNTIVPPIKKAMYGDAGGVRGAALLNY